MKQSMLLILVVTLCSANIDRDGLYTKKDGTTYKVPIIIMDDGTIDIAGTAVKDDKPEDENYAITVTSALHRALSDNNTPKTSQELFHTLRSIHEHFHNTHFASDDEKLKANEEASIEAMKIFVESLDKREAQACVKHEAGHIYYGHLLTSKQLAEKKEYDLLQERELEADKYAINHSLEMAIGLISFLHKNYLLECFFKSTNHTTHPCEEKRLTSAIREMQKAYANEQEPVCACKGPVCS